MNNALKPRNAVSSHERLPLQSYQEQFIRQFSNAKNLTNIPNSQSTLRLAASIV
ncbi:hypothetical protein GS682_12100 [Nostoc sp. B(2019)]|nr:hypothetical protein [Nostoc sp. B(2019)]